MSGFEIIDYTKVLSSSYDVNVESSESQLTDTKDPTFWKRVRYNGEDSISTRPWKLKYIHGQGYAAFATRSFKAGDWICTEFPVVWIHGHHPFSESQVEEIISKVDALGEEDKEAFYAMANVFDESECHNAVGIFMTNCFDMTDSIYGECCAMYLALARLNHSCIPNAQQTHIPETAEEVLYASRDIAEGEEINDCYIDLRHSYQYRQSELQEYYRFKCECKACARWISDASFRDVDDDIRQLCHDYQDHLIDKYLCPNGESGGESEIEGGIAYLNNLITSIETPNNVQWSIRYLPEAYQTLYQLYTTLATLTISKEKKKQYSKLGIKALKKVVKLNYQLQGDRSPESIKSLLELKKYLS